MADKDVVVEPVLADMHTSTELGKPTNVDVFYLFLTKPYFQLTPYKLIYAGL